MRLPTRGPSPTSRPGNTTLASPGSQASGGAFFPGGPFLSYHAGFPHSPRALHACYAVIAPAKEGRPPARGPGVAAAGAALPARGGARRSYNQDSVVGSQDALLKPPSPEAASQ
nr:uncharacterized protein LOC123570335 [Macaca fascicularis]